MSELSGTYDRLAARMTLAQKQSFDPVGPGTTLEETVTIMATILGAEDPYLVVLYPELLDDILANRQPEWMESFTDVPELA